MLNNLPRLTFFLLCLLGLFLFIAPGNTWAESLSGCATCHTDDDMIDELTEELIAQAVEPAVSDMQEGTRCSVSKTSFDLFEKILVDPDFLETTHGKVPCQNCHKGNPDADTPAEGHKGMVKDPSIGNAAAACGPCHEEITNGAKDSFHSQPATLFASMKRRSSPEQYKMLQEKQVAEKHCMSCHQSSCGTCHVSRPDSTGGGLRKGHFFQKTPDFVYQCAPCHEEPVANDFTGVQSMGDVHYRDARMVCIDCHTGNEMHASSIGVTSANRYETSQAPQCTDCHQNLEQGAIRHHGLHAGKVHCTVCHGQAYQNCSECHVGTDEYGIQYFQSNSGEKNLKIGLNTNNAATENEPEYVLVRQVPIQPDTYKHYIGSDLENFDADPTFKRNRSTHSIQRKTWQAAHCNHCHGNPDIFLTKDDVEPELQKANENVIVPPEKIPAAIPNLAPMKKAAPPKDPLIRVSPQWLNDHLNDEDLIILDVRDMEPYEEDHIPGSYNLCACHVRTNNVAKPPFMMKSPGELAAIFQDRIPLTPDKRVVIYGSDSSSRGVTFLALESMGHTKISFLEDSFDGWEEMDFDTEDGPSPEFKPVPPYPVQTTEVIINSKTLQKELETGDLILIDPRKASQYKGHTKRREAHRPGRIPGAINLPLQALMDNEGKMLAMDELSWVLNNIHIYPGVRGTIVTSCNTNALAAELYMILRSLGHDNILVHDGSWIEWADMTK